MGAPRSPISPAWHLPLRNESSPSKFGWLSTQAPSDPCSRHERARLFSFMPSPPSWTLARPRTRERIARRAPGPSHRIRGKFARVRQKMRLEKSGRMSYDYRSVRRGGKVLADSYGSGKSPLMQTTRSITPCMRHHCLQGCFQSRRVQCHVPEKRNEEGRKAGGKKDTSLPRQGLRRLSGFPGFFRPVYGSFAQRLRPGVDAGVVGCQEQPEPRPTGLRVSDTYCG
jgi:hypothetical protein